MKGLPVTEPTAITANAPSEFTEFCRGRGLTAAQVLTAFMRDLAETPDSNGSDERMLAQAWFDRVVWPEPPTRRYDVEPRPAGLGGGWQLRLIEDGEDAGGGVFPADIADPDAMQEAHDEALERGEDWVGWF